MRWLRILLVVVAVACFAVALSYPIRYRLKQESNNSALDQLAEMRHRAQSQLGGTDDAPEATRSSETGLPRAEATEGPEIFIPVAPDEDEILRQAGLSWAKTTEAPEISLPQVGATEPPEDSLPGDGATQPPEVSLPGDGATQPPEISLPQVGATEPPEVSQPGEGATQPPEVSLPQVGATEPPEVSLPGAEDTPRPTRAPGVTPGFDDLRLDYNPHARQTAIAALTAIPTAEPTPAPTLDRFAYDGPLPYPMKEKVEFDESAILPELRDIYELNHDLIGWLTIPGTIIDYPVVQVEDSEYYLEHDFYGNSNMNGQIILDSNCDPYTPSYNLVISGHHMQNGSMFGDLPEYRNKSYWEKRKFVEFDTLMARKQYVIFAVFYSADYDEDEEGFRYNADVRYLLDTRHWLEEIEENKLYDTGIDVAFGDEFITLTTCNRVLHKNGRFVVVCRRIREGETFE